MESRTYLWQVNRYLSLPPRFRLRELNNLARILSAAKQRGEPFFTVYRALGSPFEYAMGIQSRYPGFRKSGWRHPFGILAFLGCWQFVCGLFALSRQEAAPLALPPELAAVSPRLTPSQIFLFCALAAFLGFYFYFRLKYIPDESAESFDL